jgi:hypothetical protein
MSDRVRSIPSYRRHKQSGQAIVTLPDGTGGRRDVLLGRWQSPESHQEFARVIAAWQAAGRRLIDEPATTGDLSIHELLVAFLRHADQHYRHADGRPTSEVREYECTFRPLKALFGNTRAVDFSPLSLKAVRNRMIEDKLCRGVSASQSRMHGRGRRFRRSIASSGLPAQCTS